MTKIAITEILTPEQKWENVRLVCRKTIYAHLGEIMTPLVESNILTGVMMALEDLHPCRYFDNKK